MESIPKYLVVGFFGRIVDDVLGELTGRDRLD